MIDYSQTPDVVLVEYDLLHILALLNTNTIKLCY